MSGVFSGKYSLKNRQTGVFEEAWVKSPIAAAHVADFQDHWRPMFDARIEELEDSGQDTPEQYEALNLQDAHWRWPEKVEALERRLDWASFVVEADGHTQGLMFLELTRLGQEPSHRGKPIVTIELLATAPWNRSGLVDKPKYKGVGLLLLAAAISKSVEDEFGGRIGLHALKQAESWYRDVCGMTDLGVDRTNMRYFEMTEAQAKTFLGRDW